MKNFQNKILENRLKNSIAEKENSLGFELVIKDLDIEKQMTKFTFKHLNL